MSMFAQARTQAAAAPAPATAPAPRPPAPAPATRPAAPPQNYDQPRQPAPANIYDGVENEADERRNYLDGIGDYILRVIKVSDGVMPEGTKNAGKAFFGADFEVVQSNNDEHAVGAETSFITTLGRFPKYFKRDVNGFMSALFGCDSSQITRETVTDAVSERNPAAGMLIGCRVRPDSRGGVNEKTGRPYTSKQFFNVPQG